MAQSCSGRRLDRYRLARDHRKCDPLRPARRRIGCTELTGGTETSSKRAYGRIAWHEPDIDRHIDAATQALLACQRADGHWLFELEADATIPAEYVLLRHYLGEPVDAALEASIGIYLRRIQGAHDGWPLFPTANST